MKKWIKIWGQDVYIKRKEIVMISIDKDIDDSWILLASLRYERSDIILYKNRDKNIVTLQTQRLLGKDFYDS